jgi:hypothetical protein
MIRTIMAPTTNLAPLMFTLTGDDWYFDI